jgi:hypothetical protein
MIQGETLVYSPHIKESLKTWPQPGQIDPSKAAYKPALTTNRLPIGFQIVRLGLPPSFTSKQVLVFIREIGKRAFLVCGEAAAHQKSNPLNFRIGSKSG